MPHIESSGDEPAGLLTEELELELLLEALRQRFGYDYRAYDRMTVRRKVHAVQQERGLATVSLLQNAVLHEAGVADQLLRALAVQPMLLFDDPEQARLTRIALACLHASPVPRVWMPDCAGAEAAWSLAILLAEEQLHARTEIFATVATEELLREALEASIPLERMAEYQENYLKSGGRSNLAGYFDIKGKRATLVETLRARITWSQYNIVTDASPNEFQMIIARRMLPDLGPVLRQRVLRLFHESLCLFGVINLDRPFDGTDPLASQYQQLIPSVPWYKRIQ
ncbi:chemotaxis protein [Massilia arenosa]|uniref:Chemotaxis protein n=2 Tax=Zemynaea arenosa TaxID=2561931 RepID=A0A4Y9SFM4_9BURK|nr:chemotaxis protein [Massilia arenosa]